MTKSFNLIKEQGIPEINATAKLYIHKRTGARLLSIINDDENKVFCINFRTTPKDSTGVAHILEHSVLGGSEKYPVKEPFAEILKGSLATFVNAFTYPDKTCYPLASQNLQDFYNLIDVYMDAVFHPLISEETLMQEGWHYELDDPAKPLTYKGVVFNEMKGAYSSPDNLLARTIQQSLFPKHLYGIDSGGDPSNIPDLTYSAFKSFHTTYYHPSNSFIFFYGNNDPEKRLKLMDGYLKPYRKLRVKSAIPLARPFKRPRNIKYSYNAGEDAALKRKHYFTINWLLPDTSDAVTDFSLQILANILISTPASPLKKALVDSGLGEDLAGLGLESELRQHVFSTGLKGTRSSDARKIEKLIFDTLRSLVQDGIDPEMIAAAVNTLEFRLRENNSGTFPRGIALMLRALTTWIHEDDPIKLLAFEAPLDEIRSRLRDDKRYFEKLIQTHLLDNVHRTTLRFKPDPDLGRRLEDAEKSRLDGVREALSVDQLEQIIKDSRKLKELQERPNSPEALATMPVLRLSDLDKKGKTIPVETMHIQDTQVLFHDLFTNGIVYLDLGFDLHTLPRELLPLTNIFARALLEMGTDREDFVKLSQRIGKSTGGIWGDSISTTAHRSGENVSRLFLRGKATMARSAELLNILKDVLLTAKFDDRERLKQIVLEEKSGIESALIPSGHIFVNRRVRAQFGGAGWVNDQMSGIGYLFALRSLAKEIDKKWPSVLARLESMREALVNRKSMIGNVTLDAANWGRFKLQLEDFLSRLPLKDAKLSAFNIKVQNVREGLTIPAQVNYVGKAVNLHDFGYEYNGSAKVVSGYVHMAYLWEKVRVQGGAYGGFCVFDENSGILSYLSYRDPNLDATLENYAKAPDFLKGLDSAALTEGELTKAIIAAIRDVDAYQLPDAKGYTSMLRHLTGKTDAMLQKTREEILSTNGEDFIAFGEALGKASHTEAITVIGSQPALESAKAGLTVTKVL